MIGTSRANHSMALGLSKILAALADLSALAGCVYALGAAFIVTRFAARRPERGESGLPVTVLKPLCGVDPGLYENLQSFCEQQYPAAFQLVFGVQSPADPAIAVVERLRREWPERDIAMVVDNRFPARNLKAANLINMLPKARHDWLVITDSDMRVPKDFLAAVTRPLADRAIGLVTCLYRGLPADHALWSRLAAHHINHGFLPQALMAETLVPGIATFGASIAITGETLAAVGGLAAVGDVLADDNALGSAVLRLGRRVVVLPLIIDNWLTEPSLAALFRHELRWALTIRVVAPWGYLGSVITHPVILALLGVLFGAILGAADLISLGVLVVALLSRFAMVRATDRALGLPATPVWLLPGRDLLSFVVFIAGFCTRTVTWRDRRYRVDRQGRLTLDGESPA